MSAKDINDINNDDDRDQNEVEEQKQRSRTREIDFMRVEDTLRAQALSPFELKVKEKIASAPSPFDILTGEEELEEKEHEVHETLSELLKYALLSPNQKACYELLYQEGLPDEEAALRLKISRGRIRAMRRAIMRALLRARKTVALKEAVQKIELRLEEILRSLPERAGLSPKEAAFYESIFILGASNREAAAQFAVGINALRFIKKKITRKIKSVFSHDVKALAETWQLAQRSGLILKLRYEENLSFSEIAKRLKVTESAVKKSFRQIRVKLLKDFSPFIPLS